MGSERASCSPITEIMETKGLDKTVALQGYLPKALCLTPAPPFVKKTRLASVERCQIHKSPEESELTVTIRGNHSLCDLTIFYAITVEPSRNCSGESRHQSKTLGLDRTPPIPIYLISGASLSKSYHFLPVLPTPAKIGHHPRKFLCWYFVGVNQS